MFGSARMIAISSMARCVGPSGAYTNPPPFDTDVPEDYAGRVGRHLFVASSGKKRCDRMGKRDETFHCKTSGHPDHVASSCDAFNGTAGQIAHFPAHFIVRPGLKSDPIKKTRGSR